VAEPLYPKIVTNWSIREGYLMTEKVSQSHTGQNEPKPTREERDAAFSAGGGREAAEDPVVKAEPSQAPIGTELETQADQID
jgi:hypothetical protein